MKPNKCVGLRCRLTQPTRNGQGIAIKIQNKDFCYIQPGSLSENIDPVY